MAAAIMLIGAESELVGYPCEDVAPTMVRRSTPAFVASLMLTVVLATGFYGLLNSAVSQAIDDYFARKYASVREPVPALVSQFNSDVLASATDGE